MKKPSSKIRDEIAKLQEQLRQAETREAERIGRLALKAGLGEISVEEIALLAAFEDLATGFRRGKDPTTGRKRGNGDVGPSTAVVIPGANPVSSDEA